MSNVVKINGDNVHQFKLNDQIKLYSLIDAGFKKTTKGNYTYEHPLYNESPYNAPTKLKMTINQDLDHLTMVVTDKSGLQKVNIFKNEQLAPTVELLNYIINDLIERGILTAVKE